MLEFIGGTVVIAVAAIVVFYAAYRIYLALTGGPGVEHQKTEAPTDML